MNKILLFVVVTLISTLGMSQESNNAASSSDQQAVLAEADAMIISQGDEAYDSGDFDAAIALYGQGAAVDPWDLHAGKPQILALVRATLARGDRGAAFDAAVAAFELVKDATLPDDLAARVNAVQDILDNLPEVVAVQAVMAEGELDETYEEEEGDISENDLGASATAIAAASTTGPGSDASDVGSSQLASDPEGSSVLPEPTAVPASPTPYPTPYPTAVPTTEPTVLPTAIPTAIPTTIPTPAPTADEDVTIQGPAVPPRILKSVSPEYPRRAWSMRLEGDVFLQVRVETDGSVGEVRITEVPREGVGFEQAVTTAVKKWVFAPATRQGQPVPSWVPIRIPFKMSS